jgi:uncharacterized protein with ParB-like and HNH nuclease domain
LASTLQIPLKAEQAPLDEIFGDKFLFVIPTYQRPFSWEKDNFKKLIDDMLDSQKESKGTEVYFLGSLVLFNKEGKTQEVIDGQQRLVSLTILFAVTRDLLNDQGLAQSLQKHIYQEADKLSDRPAVERVTPWPNLRRHFNDYIFKSGGTKQFLAQFNPEKIDKQDPVYHFYEAIQSYSEILSAMPEDQLEAFIEYVIQKVYLVYIMTSSRTRALRLFNTLNTRGVPLSSADIIKAANLELITDQIMQDDYAKKWIDLETDLGREELGDLLTHIRTVKVKDKARKSLEDEYENLYSSKVFQKGKPFIDYLVDMADIYSTKIVSPKVTVKKQDRQNRYKLHVDYMRDYLPFSDWVPPLLAFCEKFRNGDEYLPDFVSKLERKTFIEWLAGFTETERITSFARVTESIEKSASEADVMSTMLTPPGPLPAQTRGRVLDYTNTSALKALIEPVLNDQFFYTLKGGKIAKYVLLRLDMEGTDLNNFAGYQGMITIEHILPRNPSSGSSWTKDFSDQERTDWTNKLGNLVLLSGSKNPSAGTLDFQQKKQVYFKNKCSPFMFTSEILPYSNWGMPEVTQRQGKVVGRIEEIYLTQAP